MADITSLMDNSISIIDLEERLKEEGHNFGNYKSYFKFLRKEWHKVNSSKMDEIVESPVVEDKFPTVTVKSKGIEYLLHGIVHGAPWLLMPGWHPRKNLKDYVSRTMRPFYYNFSRGEDYLYEQNFGDYFNLQASQELKDHNHTKKTSESSIKELGLTMLSVPLVLGGLVTLPAFYGGLYVYKKYIRSSKRNLFYWVFKALSDGKYQAKFADIWYTYELPQPFNLERDYVCEKNRGFLSKAFKYGSLFMATRGERSLWIAKKLRNFASQRRKWLKRLHYLCGAGHTTEIAYFLEHPDYSFERLEKWTKNK